jgi:DNA polymerase-3 subunit delta
MRLSPETLPGKLAGSLPPVWLVFGNEPLLILESCDRIRAAARQSGCSEREVFNVETGFDWNQLREAAGSLSLFCDRRLIELRLTRVPPADGQKAIADWCERPADDTLLLISAGELEKKQARTAWVDAIDKAGVVVEAVAVSRAQLPAWIARRLKAHGLQAGNDVLALLADRVEGNLLAAQQEIDRIALLFGAGEVTIDQLTAVVADNARYELEGALDAALAGDAARALRMLDGLREEGESTVPLLWLVQRDVRALLLAAELVAQGRPESAALQAAGVWGTRQSAVAPALRRLRPQALRALLADCAKTEKTNKGQAPGEPWDAMASLLLRIAGRKAPPGTGREFV